MSWRIKIKITIFFPWLFAISALCSEGLAQESVTIVPGRGVAEFKIDDFYPSQTQDSQGYGIKLIPTSDNQKIAKIEITSSRYLLEGSWLRVNHNTKEDVLRFYGKYTRQDNNESAQQDNKEFELNYPYSGVSFTIDEKSGIISKITIFKPKLKRTLLKSPTKLKIFKDLLQEK